MRISAPRTRSTDGPDFETFVTEYAGVAYFESTQSRKSKSSSSNQSMGKRSKRRKKKPEATHGYEDHYYGDTSHSSGTGRSTRPSSSHSEKSQSTFTGDASGEDNTHNKPFKVRLRTTNMQCCNPQHCRRLGSAIYKVSLRQVTVR